MQVASCPNCGAYEVIEDEHDCWRCSVNLVPACGNCLKPVSLGAGMCFSCEMELHSIVLVRRPTETTV